MVAPVAACGPLFTSMFQTRAFCGPVLEMISPDKGVAEQLLMAYAVWRADEAPKRGKGAGSDVVTLLSGAKVVSAVTTLAAGLTLLLKATATGMVTVSSTKELALITS